MPEFIYRAVDSDRKAVDGTMDETSAHRVAANLREKGLQVNSVKLAEKPRGLPFLKPRLTWDDIDLLNEQLRLITKSGLPLAASLKTLGRDVHSRRFKSVVTDIAARFDAGESVEDAFAAHPESFPTVYLSMLRAGGENRQPVGRVEPSMLIFFQDGRGQKQPIPLYLLTYFVTLSECEESPFLQHTGA